MISSDSRKRLAAAVQFASKHRLRELVASVLGLVSLGVGFSMIFSPSAHTTPTFRVLTDWIDPRVAGMILLFLVLLGALSFVTHQMKSAAIVALLSMITYFGIAMAFMLAATQGGVPSAIWSYMGYGLLSLIVLCACAVEAVEDD